MKTLNLKLAAILLLLFTLSPALMAQPDKEPKKDDDEIVIQNDTTEISMGKRKVIISKDSSGTRIVISKGEDWRDEDRSDRDGRDDRRDDRSKSYNRSDVDFFAWDIGLTNFFTNGAIGTSDINKQLVLKPGISLHMGFHFLPTTVSLTKRGHVNLKSALTLDFNMYNFERDFRLVSGAENLTLVDPDPGVSYKKNKLNATYLQLPLMLNFNTNPQVKKKSVSLSAGAYAGVLVKGKVKQKLDDGTKFKETDRFNLNRFRYGLTARLDFRWFDFYFNYNLSDMFAKGEEGIGKDMQTFSAGINIFDF
jgi:hypothetical protein